MKIRNGFVSNSSSSSFIVLLPENFVESLDFSKYMEEDENFPVDKLKEVIGKLIIDKEVWEEELYDLLEDDDYEDLQDTFFEILKDYVIAELSTSSDAGIWAVADKVKVKKILADEN